MDLCHCITVILPWISQNLYFFLFTKLVCDKSLEQFTRRENHNLKGQVPETYSFDSNKFEFVGQVARTKVWSLRLDFLTKKKKWLVHTKGLVPRNLFVAGLTPRVCRPLKARLHGRFLSQQLNAVFVALKLQLQNRTCAMLGNLSLRYEMQLTKHGDFE